MGIEKANQNTPAENGANPEREGSIEEIARTRHFVETGGVEPPCDDDTDGPSTGVV